MTLLSSCIWPQTKKGRWGKKYAEGLKRSNLPIECAAWHKDLMFDALFVGGLLAHLCGSAHSMSTPLHELGFWPFLLRCCKDYTCTLRSLGVIRRVAFWIITWEANWEQLVVSLSLVVFIVQLRLYILSRSLRLATAISDVARACRSKKTFGPPCLHMHAELRMAHQQSNMKSQRFLSWSLSTKFVPMIPNGKMGALEGESQMTLQLYICRGQLKTYGSAPSQRSVVASVGRSCEAWRHHAMVTLQSHVLICSECAVASQRCLACACSPTCFGWKMINLIICCHESPDFWWNRLGVYPVSLIGDCDHLSRASAEKKKSMCCSIGCVVYCGAHLRLFCPLGGAVGVVGTASWPLASLTRWVTGLLK